MATQGEFYKEVNLDSGSFRYGSVNKPTFYFNTFMDDMDYLNVGKVIVPTTYYVFTSAYTSCTINNVAVSWPQGNYTPAEWITTIGGLYPALGITITYSPITNKLTFTGLAAFTIVFGASELASTYLGFTTGTFSSSGNSIVSPNVVQMSGPNYLILHARIASVFNDNSIYFTPTQALGVAESRDKMCIIPITENRNSVMVYDMVLDHFFEWLDTSTRNIEFYFTLGTRQEVVDFNGSTFQIKLTGYSYNGGLSASRQNQNQKASSR